MDTIRVLIADDHVIVRQGIRSMLANVEGIQVVGEADDSPSVLRIGRSVAPDVILLDIRMPGASGIQVAKLLRKTVPSAKILILTTYQSDEFLVEAIEAGVRGYLLKDISREDLVTAIRYVHEGHHLLGQAQIDRVLTHFQNDAYQPKKFAYSLSEEDMQILRLMSEGCSNREIGARQFWSEITVKRKIQQIFKKLDVADRAQAVAEAFRQGLL
jgi:two-component system, NarL family, response regulator LiaR